VTAQELYDLTAPLYAKHPTAKPPWLCGECLPIGYWRLLLNSCQGVRIPQDDAVESMMSGYLLEWMCRKGNAKIVTCVNERWYVHDWRSSGRGSTLLHALVEAAMEVPVC
jgi:hypothetical protein